MSFVTVYGKIKLPLVFSFQTITGCQVSANLSFSRCRVPDFEERRKKMISCHCVKFDTTHIRTVYLSGIQTLYSKYIRTHIKTLPHKIGTETIFKIGNSKIENQIEAEIGN